MSTALYKQTGALRFWNEEEIQAREQLRDQMALLIKRALILQNPAWRFVQTEAPLLIPRSEINPEYGTDDVFITNHTASGEDLCLRAETTASTYAVARDLLNSHKKVRLPLCVWQMGKSFRREKGDGASPSKMRYNEFYQLEFQCIYSDTTKADYRDLIIGAVAARIERLTGCETRVVPSDRIPSYSRSTMDIEAKYRDEWREVASCSLRTDFEPGTEVCEIAIGADRVVEMMDLDQ